MNATFIIAIALVVLVAAIAGIYNSLVAYKNAANNAWAQIDTQLKRRHDLIPNLLECVKGYMAHEKETLELVINARSKACSISDNPKAQSQAENTLSGTLKNLFALAENYPDLKANQNFLSLQEELSTTENRIAFARTAYNDAVMLYTNKKEQFPSNIIASMFNFKSFDYFEIDDSEKAAVKVSF